VIRRLTEGRTLMIVEHDMSVVFWTGRPDFGCWVYGQIIASGTPQEIRASEGQEAYLGEEAA